MYLKGKGTIAQKEKKFTEIDYIVWYFERYKTISYKDTSTLNASVQRLYLVVTTDRQFSNAFNFNTHFFFFPKVAQLICTPV